MVEIERSNQWLPVLNGMTNKSLSLWWRIALNIYFITNLDLAVFEFSSSFVGQDMLETSFPCYGEFVVACAFMQNAKFIRHM
jgi:hypothetical protein